MALFPRLFSLFISIYSFYFASVSLEGFCILLLDKGAFLVGLVK